MIWLPLIRLITDISAEMDNTEDKTQVTQDEPGQIKLHVVRLI